MKRPGLWRRRRVWLLVVNAMGYSAGPEASARVIRRVAKMNRPAFVFLSECIKIRVADHVDTSVWQVIQFGELGSAESGTALMVRRSKARVRGDRLFLASPHGGGIDNRSAVAGLGQIWLDGRWQDFADVVSSHVPPRRYPTGQDVHVDRLEDELHDARRPWPRLIGADWNMPKDEIRWRMGVRPGQVRRIGVLGVVATPDLRMGYARLRRVHSDHLGVLVPVILPREVVQ